MKTIPFYHKKEALLASENAPLLISALQDRLTAFRRWRNRSTSPQTASGAVPNLPSDRMAADSRCRGRAVH